MNHRDPKIACPKFQLIFTNGDITSHFTNGFDPGFEVHATITLTDRAGTVTSLSYSLRRDHANVIDAAQGTSRLSKKALRGLISSRLKVYATRVVMWFCTKPTHLIAHRSYESDTPESQINGALFALRSLLVLFASRTMAALDASDYTFQRKARPGPSALTNKLLQQYSVIHTSLDLGDFNCGYEMFCIIW